MWDLERMPPKKFFFIILLFLMVLSTISFFRLFGITINTSTPSRILLTACSTIGPTATEHPSELAKSATSHEDDLFTTKEYRLLWDVISRKAPCNLLFFGLSPQLISLSKLNAAGTTVFLEDDVGKLRVAAELESDKIHIVKYTEKAGRAYELLEHGRHHPECRMRASPLKTSHCKLALTTLPQQVRLKEWDIVVVDGPRGDHPEAPGRMGAIYTAAAMARAGRTTDVLVHDVDRMIERWYSWEFLCHENLASAKGRFWHFKIQGNSSSTRFCSDDNIRIE